MTEEVQQRGTSNGKKAGGIAAIIIAAASGVASFTMDHEGVRYKAYKDALGNWTICAGRAHGVKPGQVATKTECETYFKEDMQQAMTQIVAMTPTLAENNTALQAGGDLAFNAGPGNWKKSPMATFASQRQWKEACNAFSNYIIGGYSPKPIRGAVSCKPTNTHRYFCVLPGLVKRRNDEKQLCLGDQSKLEALQEDALNSTEPTVVNGNIVS